MSVDTPCWKRMLYEQARLCRWKIERSGCENEALSNAVSDGGWRSGPGGLDLPCSKRRLVRTGRIGNWQIRYRTIASRCNAPTACTARTVVPDLVRNVCPC